MTKCETCARKDNYKPASNAPGTRDKGFAGGQQPTRPCISPDGDEKAGDLKKWTGESFTPNNHDDWYEIRQYNHERLVGNGYFLNDPLVVIKNYKKKIEEIESIISDCGHLSLTADNLVRKIRKVLKK